MTIDINQSIDIDNRWSIDRVNFVIIDGLNNVIVNDYQYQSIMDENQSKIPSRCVFVCVLHCFHG